MIAPIPGYRILRELGRGGMATVYLAVQESLGREVALKVLSPAMSQDATGEERFLREARIAASLHHPNIVPVHDLGLHEGRAYIAMEFEPGGSVVPPRGERLEPRAALRVLRDIAAALDFAHGRGVVHRDIKPDNILRRPDGAAVLSDFGIARLMDSQTLLTAEGTSVGTPHYMSPEQLRGDRLDGRSDLYSLGVVLWQLLTGELPYVGTDVWAIGTQHLSAPVPTLPAELAHLQGLVDALMAKRAQDRPATGAELIRRIDGLLDATPTPPTVTVAHVAGAGVASRGRPRWLLPLGAAAVLALIAYAGWQWKAGPAPRATPAPVATPSPAPAPSIAVMAFEDLSAGRDQTYFADGVSEELLNRLSQVQGLRVAGRSSSMSFKGKSATIAQIGEALDVAHVLEGTVRREGKRLRVSVQLSKASDGFQLWSHSYDRQVDDIFAVQDDIAGAVVEALKLRLLSAASRGRHQPSFEVFDQYLIARQALARSDPDSFRLSREAFGKAVAMDPDYAEAWSGLAMAQSFVASMDPDPAAAARGKAEAMRAAERAIALDPTLGDAYGARGYLRGKNELDWAGALADTEKAVSLDPNDGRNQLRYGFLLAAMDRLPEARAAFEAGIRVDPLLTPTWFWLGRVAAAQGDYPAAKRALNRVLAIEPQSTDARGYLGVIDLLQGKAGQALPVFQALKRPYSALMARYTLGERDGLEAELAAVGAADHGSSPYSMALVYSWMGNQDKAFEWLDRAIEVRDTGIQVLTYDPGLRRLREDPRYRRLLARLKLPPPKG